LVLARRLGRTHWAIALRTSDRALARRLAARATAAVESLAAAVAMTAQDPIQPTDAELMESLREMFCAIIARGEREHLLRPANWDPDAISDYDTDEEREIKALDDPMDRAHYWRGVLLRNAYEEIRPYTEAALRRLNRATPEPDESHRAFLLLFRRDAHDRTGPGDRHAARGPELATEPAVLGCRVGHRMAERAALGGRLQGHHQLNQWELDRDRFADLQFGHNQLPVSLAMAWDAVLRFMGSAPRDETGRVAARRNSMES
jgi:hypothetical protein